MVRNVEGMKLRLLPSGIPLLLLRRPDHSFGYSEAGGGAVGGSRQSIGPRGKANGGFGSRLLRAQRAIRVRRGRIILGRGGSAGFKVSRSGLSEILFFTPSHPEAGLERNPR